MIWGMCNNFPTPGGTEGVQRVQIQWVQREQISALNFFMGSNDGFNVKL